MHTPGSAVSGYVLLLIVQIILIIIFGVYARYGDALMPSDNDAGTKSAEKHVPSYPHFQDVHAMIFVGFAFLMTFLRKYGYSASGFNFFAAALIIQFAIIFRGFFELEGGYIKLSVDNMIGADIASATVLISMGVLLGRITPIQLLFMGIIEIAIFAANEHFQLQIVKMVDAGGAIVVHGYGAYFGLAVSFVLRPKSAENAPGKFEGASYTSDLFAMIGTLFLWIFWPSFNSAFVDGDQQNRAILNTYLSLAAATVTTFVLSAIVSHENKLDIVHVQNSTLAGGVAIGSVCNLLIGPHSALLIGAVAGIVSVLGYRYLTPLMRDTLRLHDTCGVHNLHGTPAVISSISSAVFAVLATKENYKDSMSDIFSAMDAKNSTTAMKHHSAIIGGFGRSAWQQCGYQLLGGCLTIAFAIAAGLITGLILKLPIFRQLENTEYHEDKPCWEVASNTENSNP